MKSQYLPLLLPLALLHACGEGGEPVPSVVNAHWSFGNCGGGCLGEVEFLPAGPRFKLYEHFSDDPALVDNVGHLTLAYEVETKSILSSLDILSLEETYGCPDCADGGAFGMTLEDGDVQKTTTFGYFSPPAELESIEDIVLEVMYGLRFCETNDYVVPTEDCVPDSAD